ncbi:hypothetical protein [Sorangium sp. So ce1182]|uniref:hypothetical protein n=1 Tax=Sorangium sp. So ce1182 TaxID=3133334 RepID=UPI003F5FF323
MKSVPSSFFSTTLRNTVAIALRFLSSLTLPVGDWTSSLLSASSSFAWLLERSPPTCASARSAALTFA